MHSKSMFILASILGLVALQMLLFFITSLDSTRVANFRNVLGLVLLASLLSSFLHADFYIEEIIKSSGDCIFVVRNPVYYALEALFIGYVFAMYTVITFKIALKARRTEHASYAWLQFIAVVLTTSIVGFVELIYVKISFQTLLLSLYGLTFYAPLAYTLVTTITLVGDRGLYTAFLYKLHRLVVFETGGVPIFAFDFAEDVRHHNELVAGMISAVTTAVSEVVESSRYVKQVVLEDRVILLQQNGNLFFVLIADKATKMTKDSFNVFVNLFSNYYNSHVEFKVGEHKRVIKEKAVEFIYKAFPYIAPLKDFPIKRTKI